MKTFETVFGSPPTVTASAPGRVNLLGEHTDYNDGYVLPIAIPQKTYVSVRRSASRTFALYAASLDKQAFFSQETAPREHYARYVYGCVRELQEYGCAVPPLDIYVRSHVPIGVGLSSSAALEVATLRAVRELLSLPISDVVIAQLAQRAEITYAGVRCGIMDQMAASLADASHMLFLDARTLETRLVDLPRDAEVLVIDSGVPRALATSKYNERRAECEEAARLLGVSMLRDVRDPAAAESLPDPYCRRARHVITENARVMAALQLITGEQFGVLMNASHASLRDDFEVSIPELDLLTELLRGHADVYGARLTGAGFGGACVALGKVGHAGNVAQDVLREYRRTGHKGQWLVPARAS